MSTNVDIQDFTLVAKKDACTSTAEIDLVNNKTYYDMIDLNTGNQKDDILASHPFLEMIENFGVHLNPFSLSNIENMCHVHLLPSNLFLEDCGNNTFVDSPLPFPTVLEDEFANIPVAHRESEAYCKEWVEKHRKGYIKTMLSFSSY
ncbi:hypothetical protein AVEN_218473-1 [Araneus ventricosus]|uniref:Uncharacterized protein n=1 Tax=Araneus ventricosus TaxID=182803 RepID=A0A4Y2BY99_ARAVE|nr:hypothetical protein AVEN_74776-1 [Araneus ventricosus]GBL96537.1 hypothetical protein AVEN_218473-1 [Araneus ventricosus]